MDKRDGAAGRREIKGGNFEAAFWLEDGEFPSKVMVQQAKRILVHAARTGRGSKWLRARWCADSSVLAELHLRFAKGGCVILDSVGSGTKLGADLVLAIEALGAGNKVRIECAGGAV